MIEQECVCWRLSWSMSITVIASGASPEDVVVHVDPLLELGALVHAVLHGSHHPRTQAARERILESDSGELMARAQRFRLSFGVVRSRFLLPTALDGAASPSIESRMNDIAEMPIERFAQFTAISLVEDSRTFRETDPISETDLFLRELERMGETPLELGRSLLDDPEGIRRQLLGLLEDLERRWFRREWEECRGLLVYEADLRRRELAQDLVTGIATVSPTAVVSADRESVVFDKINRARFSVRSHGLILAPSYHVSPHLIAKHDGVYPSMITYAVGEAANSVSLDDVKQRLQALLDDARMEICRCVARTPSTTVDLAIELQMTQPQVSRHLRTLRNAGLVSREQRGRYVYYTLNTAVLRTLGAQVIATLLR